MATAQVIGTRAPSTWGEFVFTRKGDLTLALSAIACFIGFMIVRFSSWTTFGGVVLAMSEAALVGGLCDYIALRMIFERRWYLPHSGVLPRNRVKLIDGIAKTIEKEWLTPEMIERKLHQVDLVARTGAYLEEVQVDELLDSEVLGRILERITASLENERALDRIEAILRKVMPKSFERVYTTLNKMGLRSLSSRMVANLKQRIPELRSDPELMGTIEAALHELGVQLRDDGSFAHRRASAIMDRVVRRTVEASRGEITEMVKENLGRLTDEQIRVQIESRTRSHLDWIRVNGGIFGALFGLIFAIAEILAQYGPTFFAGVRSAM